MKVQVTTKQIKQALSYYNRFGIEANAYGSTICVEMQEAYMSIEISEAEIIRRAEQQQDYLQEQRLEQIVNELKKINPDTIIGLGILTAIKAGKFDRLIETTKSQYKDNNQTMIEVIGEKLIKKILKY